MSVSAKKASVHKGLHVQRITGEGHQNIREAAFSEVWSQRQDRDELLAYLMGSNNVKGEFSLRDAQVAATVIQWLGSHVGEGFLEEVATKIAAKH